MTVRTTRYFVEQVLRKRPYLRLDWCAEVVATPLRREVQPEGHIRFWGPIDDPRDGQRRILRVITLADGDRPQCFLRPPFPGGWTMKLHYYPETDSLYIELRGEPDTETREIADGLNVDLNGAGQVVGFDIDHASTHLDLTTLETVQLPLKATRIA